MAYDDLPPADNPTIPTPPNPPTPPETETRNILNQSAQTVGTLTLLAGLSESVWADALAVYSAVITSQVPGFTEYSSVVPTNTNSSNYILLNGMSSVPLDAGIYSVNFIANIGTNAPLLTSPGFYISIFANGVQIPTSEVSDVSSAINLFSISPIAMTTGSQVSVLAGQKIEIKWKTNGVGNTITCTNRVLDIVRIK